MQAPSPGPATDARRARAAVAALFFANGAILASILPRYPQIKADLHLSNAAFGLAVAALPLGALVAGPSAAVLLRRFGSGRVAVVTMVLTALALLIAGVAPAWLSLAGSLFVAGAIDAIADVAQNSQGLRVQRRYGRSILNSFHAVWSMGAVVGGILGAAAAQLAVPRAVHLAASAALFGALAVASHRFLLPGPDSVDATPALNPGGAPPRRSGTTAQRAAYATLAALVVIAASAAVVEDAGSSWSAIYLSGSLGASAFVAGAGFSALQGMQFVGRVAGDRLVDRFGQRVVARAGGVIVFAGMGTALAFPTIAGTLTGFGLAGIGVATLVPAAMHGADELPGLRPGTGLTVVTWLMRAGFLVSPPIVGAIADASSLRVGLLVVPAAAVAIMACSAALPGRAIRPATMNR